MGKIMVHISCLYDPAVYYTPKELGEKDMYKHFFISHDFHPIRCAEFGYINCLMLL